MDSPILAQLTDALALRPSRSNAPNVWKGVWSGQPALVKCYQHCSPLYRKTVGRLAMSREWWALNKLASSGRSPLPLARPRPWTVVMEWVEGTPLEALEREVVPVGTLIAEAEALLASLGQAGVVHGDLGHDCWSVQGRESNLLVTDDGRMVAIDFAGCWRAGWPGLGEAMRRHDELLLTKILYHFGDETVADHPAWRLPKQRALPWWNLMALLGKL